MVLAASHPEKLLRPLQKKPKSGHRLLPTLSSSFCDAGSADGQPQVLELHGAAVLNGPPQDPQVSAQKNGDAQSEGNL